MIKKRNPKKSGLKIPAPELKRKGLHLIFGTLILALIYFAGVNVSTIVLAALIVAGAVISMLIQRGAKIPFFAKAIESVERQTEKKFPGKAAIYFFFSAFAVLFIFRNDPSIIFAAIGIQVFADSAAALVGMQIGKHKLYKNKTWEGTVTCFLVSFACANKFFPMHVAVIAALMATIVEVLPLDDNVWVPIITAATIKALI